MSLNRGTYHSAINTGWGFIHSDSPFAFNVEDRKALHKEIPDLSQVTPNQTYFKYYRQKRDKLAGRGEPPDTVELEGAPSLEQAKEILKNTEEKNRVKLERKKNMKPPSLQQLLKMMGKTRKPVENPMAGKGCRGGRFVKGSKEAKAYMAHLRSLRGKGSYNKAAIKGGSSYNKAAIKGGSSYNKAAIKGGAIDIDPDVLKDYAKVYGKDFLQYAMSEEGQNKIGSFFTKIKNFFTGKKKNKELEEVLEMLKITDPEKYKKIIQSMQEEKLKKLLGPAYEAMNKTPSTPKSNTNSSSGSTSNNEYHGYTKKEIEALRNMGINI